MGVEQVLIADGIDGEDTDEPCLEANGQTWTLEQYQSRILEHPNCTRNATPVPVAAPVPA